MPDYYEVLGVDHEASEEDIRQARKLLSRLWHPDQNKRGDAAARFDEIQKAAEVLLDPALRAAYDQELAASAAGSTADNDVSSGSAPNGGPSEVWIEPEIVDFGDLEPDTPGSEAQIIISWTGQEPSLTIPPYGDWWTRTEVERPEANPQCYIITLQAVAHAGMASGRYRSEFIITVDGHPYPVKLTARVVAAASKPPPVRDVPRTRAPTPPPPSPVGDTGRGRLLPILIGALVVIVLVIVVVVGIKSGGSKQAGRAPGPSSSHGLLDLSSSQTLAGSTSFLLSNSDILVLGNGSLTLLGPRGTAIWSKSASISDLVIDDNPDASPQFSGHCAIASDAGGAGLESEFISLDTGAQRATPGYGIISGNRAAWSDGTIRNACTGAVLGRAAPNSAYSFPECLHGSEVVGGGGFGESLSAWQGGQELWQRSQNDNAVCDHKGTTLILNSIAHSITRINPGTGQTYWSARDVTCANRCLSENGPPYILSEIGGVLLVSGYNNPGVVALNEKTGKILWFRTSGCLLGAQDTQGIALVGLCPAPAQDSGFVETAAAVDVSTGATIRNFKGSYNQWSANASQLLVVDNQMGAARTVNW